MKQIQIVTSLIQTQKLQIMIQAEFVSIKMKMVILLWGFQEQMLMI